MKLSTYSTLLFALFILLLLTAPLEASTVDCSSSALLAGWFDFVPGGDSRPTRTTVIRVAALGMVLALIIMYRSKH